MELVSTHESPKLPVTSHLPVLYPPIPQRQLGRGQDVSNLHSGRCCGLDAGMLPFHGLKRLTDHRGP